MNDMILSNSILDATIHDLTRTLNRDKETKKTNWIHRFAEETHFEIAEYMRDSKHKCECVYWLCLFLLLVGVTVLQMIMVIIKYEGKFNKFFSASVLL